MDVTYARMWHFVEIQGLSGFNPLMICLVCRLINLRDGAVYTERLCFVQVEILQNKIQCDVCFVQRSTQVKEHTMVLSYLTQQRRRINTFMRLYCVLSLLMWIKEILYPCLCKEAHTPSLIITSQGIITTRQRSTKTQWKLSEHLCEPQSPDSFRLRSTKREFQNGKQWRKAMSKGSSIVRGRFALEHWLKYRSGIETHSQNIIKWTWCHLSSKVEYSPRSPIRVVCRCDAGWRQNCTTVAR